ncbi:MAG: hypothetical protein ACM3X6_03750 [Patescibacteria group bacterium]
MSRGRIKSILHTAHISQASLRGRHRICRGDSKNHIIPFGGWYLGIKDGLEEKSYCLKCARAILEKGQMKLDILIKNLEKAERNA